MEQVYDLTIPGTHNFVANDVCVHNTALALNAPARLGEKKMPVAIFSLEMSKEQLVQRSIAQTTRIPRAGFEEWQRKGRRLAEVGTGLRN